MQNLDVSKKVEHLILDILNIENLPPDASIENTEEWDSFAYLSIVFQLETEFDIKINQENINKFNSIENIVAEIKLCKQTKP